MRSPASRAVSVRPLLRRRAARIAPLVALLLAPHVLPLDARASAKDPAARGLDVFVHLPAEAAPGGSVPLQLQVYGFPTVTTLAPLDGATLEAVWDPESLGPGVSSAPPPVRATSDATGRLHLDVPVPSGPPRALRLLVGVRHGEHKRTRSFDVSRVASQRVSLHVPDAQVVPGSETPAWILATSAVTGAPLPRAQVELALSEGGLPRWSRTLTTDDAGTAVAKVPVPFTDEPGWSWTLTATALGASADEAEATVLLSPREETPATPTLLASFSEPEVIAGDAARFRIGVRDAAGRPVGAHPVRYWIGPKGTEAPVDKDAWERASTLARTDLAGEITGETPTPSTVVAGVGTELSLVVRTELDGHELVQQTRVGVDAAVASVELQPEGGVVVPGLRQRLFLRARDGRDRGIVGTFTLRGDGLDARVLTDAWGEAEVSWNVPAEVGALRQVGPCAGGVAAAVVIRWEGELPALAGRADPFEPCVRVDRDATSLAVLAKPIVRSGSSAEVVLSTVGQPAPWSVVLRAADGPESSAAWLPAEGRGAIPLPEGAMGPWNLGAAAPLLGKPARTVAGALLAVPAVLPRVELSRSGGRAVPGGSVELDVRLVDEHGKGLAGTVAAVAIDENGGGTIAGVMALDTRGALCGALGIEDERCDRVLLGDPAFEAVTRAALASLSAQGLTPRTDPGGELEPALRDAFAEVVRSLEGAVFEASASSETLRDVRRSLPNGRMTWNPELMTLVTAAMPARPETPGGEPLALGDLLAIDPAVTFDNVAHRITRLKLFRVLAEVRAFRREHLVDPDEPALREPNALLRRIVRDGRLAEGDLLDPWGGTLAFTRQRGEPLPFVTVARTFALCSPGPDRRLDTADDACDPWQRVLRSGTPYAKAVQEDRIVDARLDMEVADATVDAWSTLFEELTGTALGGRGEGIGLSGYGSGGGGMGHGVGLGGARVTRGIASSGGAFLPPIRTDAEGRAHFTVPLGDVETTWRIAVVGVPDRARPAVTSIAVPSSVPLSARVELGATWTEGDVLDVPILLRNRTDGELRVDVAVTAAGAAALEGAGPPRLVTVPRGGLAKVVARVRAKTTGTAWLDVRTRANGVPEDVLHHEWDVRSPGELVTLASSAWVETDASLDVAVTPGRAQRIGRPWLVVERGQRALFAAALESLDADALRSPASLADAVEVGTRVERWALGESGEASRLVERARTLRRRALGRLGVYAGRGTSVPGDALVRERARAWVQSVDEALPGAAPSTCPDAIASGLEVHLAGLEAEPPPRAGAVLACWEAFVSRAVSAVRESGDPVALGRAVLALAERPHRRAQTLALAARLAERVALDPAGGIALGVDAASERTARAVVYAALLRVSVAGLALPASPSVLSHWLVVQRDPSGGYGSPQGTLAAVRALVAFFPAQSGLAHKPTTIRVRAAGFEQTLALDDRDRTVVPIDADVEGVRVEVTGEPVIARLERLVVRPWSLPPSGADGPVYLEMEWPKDAKAGASAPLRLKLRHELGRSVTLDTRIPLPPGVHLAAAVPGAREMAGVLVVRTDLDASALPSLVELPIRLDLAGKSMIPEARTRVAYEEVRPSLAPARPLVVR